MLLYYCKSLLFGYFFNMSALNIISYITFYIISYRTSSACSTHVSGSRGMNTFHFVYLQCYMCFSLLMYCITVALIVMMTYVVKSIWAAVP